MMNRIEITKRDGTVECWACNNEHNGVFVRGEHEGAYQQRSGNSQTPQFHTVEQFRRYIGRRHDVRGRITDRRFFHEI